MPRDEDASVEVDVAVIGAGMAGLAAAVALEHIARDAELVMLELTPSRASAARTARSLAIRSSSRASAAR